VKIILNEIKEEIFRKTIEILGQSNKIKILMRNQSKESKEAATGLLEEEEIRIILKEADKDQIITI